MTFDVPNVPKPVWQTVIGVVGDVHSGEPSEDPGMQSYQPRLCGTSRSIARQGSFDVYRTSWFQPTPQGGVILARGLRHSPPETAVAALGAFPLFFERRPPVGRGRKPNWISSSLVKPNLLRIPAPI